MRIAAPRERQDHDTTPVCAAALALLLATLPWHAATAQITGPCTAIENDAERLACYDRALRGTPPAPAERGVPAAAAPAAAAPATAAPVVTPAEPSRERRIRESSAPAAPAAPVAGRGSEEVIVPLVIVGVRALPSRDTLFTTDDGSTWVQTDSQRIVALPETPFNAELKSGAMGSYFLVPQNGARAIRVRPVR
jgi:hypothetical protein